MALATNFNTKIARIEEAYQDLLQVVSEHYRKYNFRTKIARTEEADQDLQQRIRSTYCGLPGTPEDH